MFYALYQDLQQADANQSPWLAADLPVNRPKNRFANILPFDHTRVKLLSTDDEEGSDYINANWTQVNTYIVYYLRGSLRLVHVVV